MSIVAWTWVVDGDLIWPGLSCSHKETPSGVDLKQGGSIPITNLARFFALANGITISSTDDRLTAVKDAGALDAETAETLRQAFDMLFAEGLENVFRRHRLLELRGDAPAHGGRKPIGQRVGKIRCQQFTLESRKEERVGQLIERQEIVAAADHLGELGPTSLRRHCLAGRRQ